MLAEKKSLRAIAPIEAKFGLHYQGLGSLPTIEEWQQVKSFLTTHSAIKLLYTDLSPEFEFIELLKQRKEIDNNEALSNYRFAITVPTLGFTDPAFDYDIRPWFLTPLMLNGFISKKESDQAYRCVEIWVTDIADNQYPLMQDENYNINFELIGKYFDKNVSLFTTLKSITLIYSLEALLGNHAGLISLKYLEKDYIEKSVAFFPPPKIQKEYLVTFDIRNKEGKIEQKREIKIDAELKNSLFVSHFETTLGQLGQLGQVGKPNYLKNEDNLTIRMGAYAEQEFSTARFGYQLKFSTPHQTKIGKVFTLEEKPTVFLHPFLGTFPKVKQSKIKKSDKNTYCFQQFFGLSEQALQEIVEIIISKEKFFSHHIRQASIGVELADGETCFNDYYRHPDMLDELFNLVVKAILQKTIPLYALSECFYASEEIFYKLSQLETDKWDKHDHWVYEKLVCKILNKVAQNVDPMALGFEWVDMIDNILSETPTDIDVQLNLEMLQGKLSPNLEVKIELFIEDFYHSAWEKAELTLPTLTITKTLNSQDFTQTPFNHKYSLLPDHIKPEILKRSK